MGISGRFYEKTATFLPLPLPFYPTACVGSLLSVALFGCTFIMVYFYWVNSIYTVYFSFPETSFRELKYHVGLIAFHSKKKDCVIQEIFTSLIMYNFSMLITDDIFQIKRHAPDIGHPAPED